MISINAIIFSNYMICEVYRSHSWRHGYPPSGLRDPEAETKTGSHFGDSFFPSSSILCPTATTLDFHSLDGRWWRFQWRVSQLELKTNIVHLNSINTFFMLVQRIVRSIVTMLPKMKPKNLLFFGQMYNQRERANQEKLSIRTITATFQQTKQTSIVTQTSQKRCVKYWSFSVFVNDFLTSIGLSY